MMFTVMGRGVLIFIAISPCSLFTAHTYTTQCTAPELCIHCKEAQNLPPRNLFCTFCTC